MENSTTIVFFLRGLNDMMSNKYIFFSFALIIYGFTILVNLTLIVTVILEKTLHEPMFIFLCSLCVNGIIGASGFYPKLMADLSSNLIVTSYVICVTQIFLLFNYTIAEFTMLTVMAYDRYIAICKPMNYHSIVTPQKVIKLLLLAWMISIFETSLGLGLIVRLPICGSDMEKIFCTTWAVAKLSCEDTTINNIYGTSLAVLHVAQSVLIFISYVNIVKISIRSQEGRNKFMQTCLPHLISMTNFTSSVIFEAMYTRYGPTNRLHALRSFMSLEFIIVPPILNPLIYGLKMKPIRQRIFRCNKKKNAIK